MVFHRRRFSPYVSILPKAKGTVMEFIFSAQFQNSDFSIQFRRLSDCQWVKKGFKGLPCKLYCENVLHNTVLATFQALIFIKGIFFIQGWAVVGLASPKMLFYYRGAVWFFLRQLRTVKNCRRLRVTFEMLPFRAFFGLTSCRRFNSVSDSGSRL